MVKDYKKLDNDLINLYNKNKKRLEENDEIVSDYQDFCEIVVDFIEVYLNSLKNYDRKKMFIKYVYNEKKEYVSYIGSKSILRILEIFISEIYRYMLLNSSCCNIFASHNLDTDVKNEFNKIVWAIDIGFRSEKKFNDIEFRLKNVKYGLLFIQYIIKCRNTCLNNTELKFIRNIANRVNEMFYISI